MSHLDLTQHITIMTMVKEGCGISVIARRIGKNRSTVRRELWNHRQPVGSGNGQPCPKLDRPPFVCNACRDLGKCRLEKSVYIADAIQQDYRETLVESRNGVEHLGGRALHAQRADFKRREERAVAAPHHRLRQGCGIRLG